MEETFETAGRNLLETCIRDLSAYRQAVKTVQSPAIRKLVESIIAQKTDQAADLKLVTGNMDLPHPEQTVAGASGTESWPDPESLLSAISRMERDYADATRALAARAGSEENRNSLVASAERSQKFASWCQDHLDLLNLF
jgi:hypothetical protein